MNLHGSIGCRYISAISAVKCSPEVGFPKFFSDRKNGPVVIQYLSSVVQKLPVTQYCKKPQLLCKRGPSKALLTPFPDSGLFVLRASAVSSLNVPSPTAVLPTHPAGATFLKSLLIDLAFD